MAIKTLQAKPLKYRIEQVRIDDMLGVHRWGLARFAAEFGHEIKPAFPIFIVFVDGQLVCYYYAQPQVCLYPAIHPKFATPRMFYECGRVVVAAAKQVFGNPLWLIESGSPAEDPALLKRLHLQQTSLRVYETED